MNQAVCIMWKQTAYIHKYEEVVLSSQESSNEKFRAPKGHDHRVKATTTLSKAHGHVFNIGDELLCKCGKSWQAQRNNATVCPKARK